MTGNLDTLSQGKLLGNYRVQSVLGQGNFGVGPRVAHAA